MKEGPESGNRRRPWKSLLALGATLANGAMSTGADAQHIERKTPRIEIPTDPEGAITEPPSEEDKKWFREYQANQDRCSPDAFDAIQNLYASLGNSYSATPEQHEKLRASLYSFVETHPFKVDKIDMDNKSGTGRITHGYDPYDDLGRALRAVPDLDPTFVEQAKKEISTMYNEFFKKFESIPPLIKN
jgi:hypothetical protein